MSTDKAVQSAKRERVYDFPSGYREQAEGMFKWLRHDGFSPEWDFGMREGEHCSGITLPEHEVPGLRALQQSNPARWGNHPDVAKMLDDNKREMEALSKVTDERLAALTPEQREWIEVLHYETGLYVQQALDLNDKLHDLAAKHFKLCHIDVTENGLSKEQEHARDAIESAARQTLDGVHGIKGAAFLYDPRGTTMGVLFESGRYDSLSGMCKVPLAGNAFALLKDNPFWKEYAPSPANDEDDSGPEPA